MLILHISVDGIYHQQHDVGLFEFFKRPFYAYRLYDIFRLSYACGIDETKCHSIECHHIFYHIPRRAMDIANDGALVAHKLVEQGRFSCVCLSYYCHGDAPSYGVACTEGFNQFSYHPFYLFGEQYELVTIGKLQFFMIGEIYLQFKK